MPSMTNPRLTATRYTHMDLADQAQAVAKLEPTIFTRLPAKAETVGVPRGDDTDRAKVASMFARKLT